MRVAFYGNIANNFYRIAKALRQHTDIEAYLYLRANDQLTTVPESDDPHLKGNYPDWIITGKYFSASTLLMPWRSPLINELRKADLCIVSELGPAYAPFSGKPVYFLTTGSDLTKFPFPLTFLPRNQWFSKGGLVAMLTGYWQRRGIHRMKEIWTQPFSPYMDALERLGIPRDDPRITPVYFPLIIDTGTFRFDPKATDDPLVRSLTDRFDFILFHPSRLMIRDDSHLRRSGQWKRNDVLFRGFAQFIRQLPPDAAKRTALVMPDRTYSDDLAIGKRMVSELGLDENVVWLKASRPEGFTRYELVKLYSISDVVADDFGIGWFGSVVLESAAVGRPILSYIDEQIMTKLYSWHPILSSNTEAGIAAHLLKLYHDPAYRQSVGERGRQWAEQFHAEASAGRIYAQQIEDVIQRLRLGH